MKIFIILIISIISIIPIIIIIINFSKNSKNISKNIYLTYKSKNIPNYIIKNWKLLNPTYNIHLYDNNDCINFLYNNYGQLYVDIFNYIKDGPIKSDFWRCCIIYKYGGVYADIDMEPLVSISSIIKNNNKIKFYTCKSMINIESVNPTIIISNKNHKILKYCIIEYIKKYKNKEKYSYWEWSIATIMYNATKKYLNKNMIYGNKIYKDILLFQEKGSSMEPGKNYDNYIEYKGKKLFMNRYKNYDSINHKFK